MSKYIIADYNSHTDAWQYVSEIGETPNDTFYTIVPYGATEVGAKPVEFETKISAKKILDPLRAQEEEFWRSTRMFGRRQPKWKIYPVN